MTIYSNIIQHKQLASQGKLIALDLGTKRIGIASCDETQTLCKPELILKRKSNLEDFNKIAEFIKESRAKALVIGFPTHMDGTEIAMTEFTRKFSQNFDEYLTQKNQELPIFLYDERLSSFEAEQISKEIPKRKKQKHFDDIAATMILESFLRTINTL